MQQLLLLLVAALTSAGAYLIGTRRLRLQGDRLGRAVVGMLHVAGTAVVFFLLNVLIGLAAVLLARGIPGVFVSVYLLNDAYLPIVSVIQAVIFECWRGDRTAR